MPERTERGYKPDGVELIRGNQGYLFFEEKPEKARRVFVDILGAPDASGVHPEGVYFGGLQPYRARERLKAIAAHEYHGNQEMARRVDELPCRELVATMVDKEAEFEAEKISEMKRFFVDYFKKEADTVALLEADRLFVRSVNTPQLTMAIQSFCETPKGTRGVLLVQMSPELFTPQEYARARATGELYEGR